MLQNNSLKDWLLLIPALLLAFSVHEMSHGLVAYWLGDNTAKREGRLSLNPLRHVDWIGFLMLMSVGFGWAKPVPVDARYFRDPKKGMALTALAGPVSNVILAFFSAVGLVLMKALMVRQGALYIVSDTIAATFLVKLLSYNCSLAMFNFLPIPPLDGSKIVGAFLPDMLYFKMMRYDRYGMIIMAVLLYTGILTPILGNGVYNLVMALYRGAHGLVSLL